MLFVGQIDGNRRAERLFVGTIGKPGDDLVVAALFVAGGSCRSHVVQCGPRTRRSDGRTRECRDGATLTTSRSYLAAVPQRTIWIASLIEVDGALSKISGKHGLESDDLDHALRFRTGLRFLPVEDDRGVRYYVWVTIRGLNVRVVLVAAGEDTYRMITAYVD